MKSLKQVLGGYLRQKLLIFFGLGVSCGAPYNLLVASLAIWIRESGVDLTTIGLFGLVLVPYSLKFLWAPFIDRISLPFLSRFGRKKAWGFVIQTLIILSIFRISYLDPVVDIYTLFGWCMTLSFLAASQEIVADALRIDTLDGDDMKEGAAIFQLGKRIGMLATGAGVIALSSYVLWQGAYLLSLGWIVIGMICLCFIPEKKQSRAHFTIKELVVAPFADLAQRHKWMILILFIIVYKMCNAMLGKMAYPFYYDIGFTKNQIALMSGTIGPWITMTGIVMGGIMAVRYDFRKTLFWLGIVEILTSLVFAVFALIGPSIPFFFVVLLFDNVVGGMGSAVFIAWLSTFCSRAYSGTQYALLDAVMMTPLAVVASTSGYFAAQMGWPMFFVFTGGLMVPALCFLKSKWMDVV